MTITGTALILAQAASQATSGPTGLELPDWLAMALLTAVLGVTGYSGKIVRANSMKCATLEASTDARLKAIEEDLRYIRDRVDHLAG